MRFVIEESFWQLFPEARVGVVVARGLDNRAARSSAGAERLAAAAAEAADALADVDFATHPAVAIWRQAYAAFGVKPSQHRSSIESLLRGAVAGRLRSVNPLVDLYNAVSLRHRLPCGGEDLATCRGDLRLTRAAGGEAFVPLGSTADEPPSPGEVIYRDEVGAICRAWNWREADRTKLTEATVDAFLCLEALPGIEPERLAAAVADLAEDVERFLGARTATHLLELHRPVVEIELD